MSDAIKEKTDYRARALALRRRIKVMRALIRGLDDFAERESDRGDQYRNRALALRYQLQVLRMRSANVSLVHSIAQDYQKEARAQRIKAIQYRNRALLLRRRAQELHWSVNTLASGILQIKELAEEALKEYERIVWQRNLLAGMLVVIFLTVVFMGLL